MSFRTVTVSTFHHAHLRDPHWTARLTTPPARESKPLIGFAMTEAEAVMDLFDQIAEREVYEEEHCER
jgi:hypothetical protein